MLKVLVADDDANMRIILRGGINGVSDCELVGEAENGMQLVKMAKELAPDVIFVDIKMPTVDGIAAAKRVLELNKDAFIVFETGHADYIDEALQMHAFDYLVKPFGLEKIHQTLEKIKATKSTRAKNAGPNVDLDTAGQDQKLMIKTNEKSHLLESKEIVLIARKGRKTVIHTSEGLVSTNEPLQGLLERLPKPMFFRSHKGYIINTTKVVEILPWGARVRFVKLAGTKEGALITAEKAKDIQAKYL